MLYQASIHIASHLNCARINAVVDDRDDAVVDAEAAQNVGTNLGVSEPVVGLSALSYLDPSPQSRLAHLQVGPVAPKADLRRFGQQPPSGEKQIVEKGRV